jgi:hypothetical protein
MGKLTEFEKEYIKKLQYQIKCLTHGNRVRVKVSDDFDRIHAYETAIDILKEMVRRRKE